MLFSQVRFLVLVSVAAAALASEPPASDKTASAPLSAASPAATPGSTPAADPKTDIKAAGSSGSDPTKGVDSKGATCTCPAPDAPENDSAKTPKEDPAKPPSGDEGGAAGSIFGLLSQQIPLTYISTTLFAALTALYA